MNSPEPGMLLFVTASAPATVREEAFVQDELTEMLANGANFWVAPVRRHLDRPNDAAIESGLATRTLIYQLLAPAVLGAAILQFARRPIVASRLLARVITNAGGRRNLATNLLSFPKGLWLARFVRKNAVSHIHAYWLAHTTSLAMVAAELGGCTWSASAFRWDIDADNCLSEKIRRAAFIRVADEFGLELIAARAKRERPELPIALIRTGVAMPAGEEFVALPTVLEFCCAGAFVEKKAQGIVLGAFAQVHSKFPATRLHFFGDGSLRERVELQAQTLQLQDVVEFHGTVPLDELRIFLQTRPVTLLPSIVTPSGEQEGIPVVLIEAMANGSPVISTDTGAIAHLITQGCGTLVEAGNVTALATAMSELLEQSPSVTEAQCRAAHQRVMSEFSLAETSRSLLGRCLDAARALPATR